MKETERLKLPMNTELPSKSFQKNFVKQNAPNLQLDDQLKEDLVAEKNVAGCPVFM